MKIKLVLVTLLVIASSMAGVFVLGQKQNTHAVTAPSCSNKNSLTPGTQSWADCHCPRGSLYWSKRIYSVPYPGSDQKQEESWKKKYDGGKKKYEGTEPKDVADIKTTNDCNLQKTEYEAMDTATTIINVIVGLVGVIAVVMIVVGGIMLATSQGDPSKATKGKHTLLYGIVGLVIALLAFAIVNFVLTSVFSDTSESYLPNDSQVS